MTEEILQKAIGLKEKIKELEDNLEKAKGYISFSEKAEKFTVRAERPYTWYEEDDLNNFGRGEKHESVETMSFEVTKNVLMEQLKIWQAEIQSKIDSAKAELEAL